MNDILLYHALHSTCSQKVRFALAAKGLSYDSRLIDLAASEQLSPWYLAINPNGVVPTLTHRGMTINDSSVICEYLDEVFSDIPLSPSDPVTRARMRAWMRYFEEVPTAAIRAPSINALFLKSALPAGSPAQQERPVQPLRKHLYAKIGRHGFPLALIEESLEQLESCLARVEGALAGGGPFLLGAKLSLADIVLLPTIVRLEDLSRATMWGKLPAVSRWYNAMQAHPAFAATYIAGARVTA